MVLLQEGFYAGTGRTSKLIELAKAYVSDTNDVSFVSDSLERDEVAFLNQNKNIGLDINKISNFFNHRRIQQYMDEIVYRKVEVNKGKKVTVLLCDTLSPLNLTKYDDIDDLIIVNFHQSSRAPLGRMMKIPTTKEDMK